MVILRGAVGAPKNLQKLVRNRFRDKLVEHLA